MKGALVVPVIACFGCGAITTQSTYTIRQRGLMPGTVAPHMPGPMLDPGSFALALSAASGFGASGAQSRDEGAPGDVVADKAARLQFSAGAGKIADVGATLDIRPGMLASALARDVDRSSYRGDVLFVPGIQVRISVADSGLYRLGFLAELGGTYLPSDRAVEVSSTTTIMNYDGSSSSSSSSSSHTESHKDVRLLARGGVFVTLLPLDGLSITVGGVVGNQLSITGYVQTTQTCTGWLFGQCSGQSESDVAVIHDVLVVTPFVSPALEISDRLRVFAQLFTTIVYDGTPLVPYGGELGIALKL
jgi:hypothetical protein